MKINLSNPSPFHFLSLRDGFQVGPCLFDVPWPVKPDAGSGDQFAVRRELDSFLAQQLQFHALVHPRRGLFPVALEPADVAVARDDPVAGDLGREGVVAERAAHGTRGRRQGACQVGVGGDPAGWDGEEEGVDSLKRC